MSRHKVIVWSCTFFYQDSGKTNTKQLFRQVRSRKIIRNSLNRKLPIKFEFDLELFLVGCFGILFGVHEFVDDLTFVASGVVMIGVLSSLFFGPLFSGMARENGLVLVEVVVFVLIKVAFGHVGMSSVGQD